MSFPRLFVEWLVRSRDPKTAEPEKRYGEVFGFVSHEGKVCAVVRNGTTATLRAVPIDNLTIGALSAPAPEPKGK